MPAFFLTFIGVVLLSFGGRDQVLVARLARALGSHPGLAVAGAIASALCATGFAIAGGLTARMMQGPAQTMLIALALTVAAAELALQRVEKEPRQPTRSLFAAWVAIVWRQCLDAPRLFIFAMAAWSGAPPFVAAGGTLAAILTLIGAISLHASLPFARISFIRRIIAAPVMIIALVIGMTDLGMLG